MDAFQIKLFLCFPDNTNPTNPPGPTENPPTANPTENPPTSSDCDGTKSGNIIRCCRKNGPCNEGEGDCNRDSECANGLVCGSNNCRRDFSSEGTLWRRVHDCCHGIYINKYSICSCYLKFII